MEKKELKQALAKALKQAVENIENLRKAELAGKAKLEQKELKKAVAAPTMPGRVDASPTAAHGTGDPANPGPLEVLQHSEKVAKNALPGAGDTTNVASTVPGMMANAEKIEICPECKGDDDKKKLCKKCSGDKLSKAGGYDTSPQMPMGWKTTTGKEPTRTVEGVEPQEPLNILSSKVGNQVVGAPSFPAQEGQHDPSRNKLFSGVSRKYDPSGDVSAWIQGKPQKALQPEPIDREDKLEEKTNPKYMESGAKAKEYRGLKIPSEQDAEEQTVLAAQEYNKKTGVTAPSHIESVAARAKKDATQTTEEWRLDRDKGEGAPIDTINRLTSLKELRDRAKKYKGDIREENKNRKIVQEKRRRDWGPGALKLSEELININGTHQKDGSDKQERYETPNKQGEKAVLPGDKDSKEVPGNDHKIRNSIPGKGKKVAKSAEKGDLEKVALDEMGKLKRAIGGDANGSKKGQLTASGKLPTEMTKQAVAPQMPAPVPPVPGAVGGLPKPKF